MVRPLVGRRLLLSQSFCLRDSLAGTSVWYYLLPTPSLSVTFVPGVGVPEQLENFLIVFRTPSIYNVELHRPSICSPYTFSSVIIWDHIIPTLSLFEPKIYLVCITLRVPCVCTINQSVAKEMTGESRRLAVLLV